MAGFVLLNFLYHEKQVNNLPESKLWKEREKSSLT